MRLQRFLRPRKSLLRSSKASWFLNSIIWELYFGVLETFFLTESWKLKLKFRTFSFGGCWGQSLLLFWKLIDETHMPKPQKYTDNLILIKKLFLVGLRGLQSMSNPIGRPCRKSFWSRLNQFLVRKSKIVQSSKSIHR